MSALKSRIADAIRINGPMPVSLFMLMCLHDPRDGYYATRPGFNADFTTARLEINMRVNESDRAVDWRLPEIGK